MIPIFCTLCDLTVEEAPIAYKPWHQVVVGQARELEADDENGQHSGNGEGVDGIHDESTQRFDTHTWDPAVTRPHNKL